MNAAQTTETSPDGAEDTRDFTPEKALGTHALVHRRYGWRVEFTPWVFSRSRHGTTKDWVLGRLHLRPLCDPSTHHLGGGWFVDLPVDMAQEWAFPSSQKPYCFCLESGKPKDHYEIGFCRALWLLMLRMGWERES